MKHKSIQSRLQSRVAKRAKEISNLHRMLLLHGDCAGPCKGYVSTYKWRCQLRVLEVEQKLDKDLLNNVPWGEMYAMTGITLRPL